MSPFGRVLVYFVIVAAVSFFPACDSGGGMNDGDDPPADGEPSKVSVTFQVVDGGASPDTAVVADKIFLPAGENEEINKDSVLAEDTAETTAEFAESSKQMVVAATAPFFENELEKSTAEFTLSRDNTVSIGLERKTAEITVIPKDSATGDVLTDAESTIYEPHRTDSTKVEGKATVTKPQRSGQREIISRQKTIDPDNGNWIRYDPHRATISASESVTVEAIMALLPACDDGIDNDGDNYVDVFVENGNGDIDSLDTGDPGCPTAEDTDEPHITYQTTVISGGEGNDVSLFVSSKEGNRELFVSKRSYYAESLEDAILGIVDIWVEVKVENGQEGEEIAVEFSCGPNLNDTNTSAITEDVGRDGWNFIEIDKVTSGFFEADGTTCEKRYLHASKVRNESPGGGNDDVFFLVAGDDTQRSFIIRWTIEKEDDHRKAQPAGLAKHDSCVRKQNSTTCASTGSLVVDTF